jgi:hypothetical protein
MFHDFIDLFIALSSNGELLFQVLWDNASTKLKKEVL